MVKSARSAAALFLLPVLVGCAAGHLPNERQSLGWNRSTIDNEALLMPRGLLDGFPRLASSLSGIPTTAYAPDHMGGAPRWGEIQHDGVLIEHRGNAERDLFRILVVRGTHRMDIVFPLGGAAPIDVVVISTAPDIPIDAPTFGLRLRAVKRHGVVVGYEATVRPVIRDEGALTEHVVERTHYTVECIAPLFQFLDQTAGRWESFRRASMLGRIVGASPHDARSLECIE